MICIELPIRKILIGGGRSNKRVSVMMTFACNSICNEFYRPRKELRAQLFLGGLLYKISYSYRVIMTFALSIRYLVLQRHKG